MAGDGGVRRARAGRPRRDPAGRGRGPRRGLGRGRWAGVRRGRGDRGAASVWTAFAACALCVLFGAVLALGQAVTARHRAGGAADLAALAAADRALWGEAEACAAAGRVAAAQGAELVRCGVTGAEAEVTARVVRGAWAPTVRARAGPGPLGPPPARAPVGPPPGRAPAGPPGGVP
ncbi:Rv3654c family TadE-like protein [Streptomyces sp. NPDC014773]|uniref:Rv3654c family TadE-like protein n=1 Tax=Streptomyces sp. NPDC014773 TaxID=3364908 RepID=UPI003702617D